MPLDPQLAQGSMVRNTEFTLYMFYLLYAVLDHESGPPRPELFWTCSLIQLVIPSTRMNSGRVFARW